MLFHQLRVLNIHNECFEGIEIILNNTRDYVHAFRRAPHVGNDFFFHHNELLFFFFLITRYFHSDKIR